MTDFSWPFSCQTQVTTLESLNQGLQRRVVELTKQMEQMAIIHQKHMEAGQEAKDAHLEVSFKGDGVNMRINCTGQCSVQYWGRVGTELLHWIQAVADGGGQGTCTAVSVTKREGVILTLSSHFLRCGWCCGFCGHRQRSEYKHAIIKYK